MNQKRTGCASSMPAGLAIGGAVSVGATLISAALMALLIEKEYMGESKIGYCVMVTLMTASFAGAMVSYAKIKRQRLMVCVLSGVLYFGILLSITALFFGGQYEAVGVTGILVLGGSMLAALAGGHDGRAGKNRRIKIRNC